MMSPWEIPGFTGAPCPGPLGWGWAPVTASAAFEEAPGAAAGRGRPPASVLLTRMQGLCVPIQAAHTPR